MPKKPAPAAPKVGSKAWVTTAQLVGKELPEELEPYSDVEWGICYVEPEISDAWNTATAEIATRAKARQAQLLPPDRLAKDQWDTEAIVAMGALGREIVAEGLGGVRGIEGVDPGKSSEALAEAKFLSLEGELSVCIQAYQNLRTRESFLRKDTRVGRASPEKKKSPSRRAR